ncbi:MAG: type II CAAX endopeptidase family protein [Gemmatimonadota bacterium]|nr:type II CAAX endopeptidase family protein [Gemmatimonadota bacterium]
MTTTRPVSAEPLATGRVVARLAAFLGLIIVSAIVVPAVIYPLVRGVNLALNVRAPSAELMTCLAMLAATAVTVRIFGESWSQTTRLGTDALGRWPLFGGLFSGWFAIAVPAGALLWVGALRMEGAAAGSWWQGAGLAAGILLPAALTEELVLRGYAFTLVHRRWGVRAAVTWTSVLFALLHLLNPGVTAQAIVLVALAGVFLAIVRLALDSLWAAWLAHFAYNFVQVAVFHTPVSGLAVPQPMYRTVSAGPDWLTGGAWGPEAGAAAAVGMLGVSFLLSVRAGWIGVHRRGWRFAIDWRPRGRREP